MNQGTACLWLIRAVFGQARATGLLFAAIAVVLLTAAVCTTAEVNDSNSLTVLFGNFTVTNGSDRVAVVRSFLFLLAEVVADTVGILFTLIWTAGFMPSFLDPSASATLFCKPMSRAGLLMGRVVGVVIFVALVVSAFVILTMLAVGFRTGVWLPGYLVAIPLHVGQFIAFYSFSVFLAVATRSVATCMVGSVLFWLLAWAMNYARLVFMGLSFSEAAAAGKAVSFGYWLLPKPADFGLILFQALGISPQELPLLGLRAALENGLVQAGPSIFSSLIFAAVMFGFSIYELNHADY